EQLQPGQQREQVGAGVERGRVEVLARGGQHAQPLLAQPLVLGQVQIPGSAVDRQRPGIGVENGPGTHQQLVAAASMPPLTASTTSAPSVGSPISSPSLTTASEARTIGSRKSSSGISPSPATRVIGPSAA